MPLEKDAQKRIRKTPKGPRVVIGLEVNDEGAIPKREIPFVLGVLAPLSGHAEKPTFKEQEAHQIDRENFDEVMAKIGPKLSFSVASAFNPGGMLSVNLNFKEMDDFEPQRVAAQVDKLREKLADRQKLSDLLGRLNSNGRLNARLQKAIESTEERRKLRKDIGA